jgi:hypothetical protein
VILDHARPAVDQRPVSLNIYLPLQPSQHHCSISNSLAVCYGCKTKDKPEGIVLQRCDVRACAPKKGHDCCIECDELKTCDKDLWRRFPKFKEQVIAMQQRYRST